MPRGGPVFRHQVVAAPRNESLTASSKIYQAGPGAEKLRRTGRRTRSREWQNEIWDYYDLVPEFRFGCDWVGNLLSRAKLYVAGPDGKETTEQNALDAMVSLFDGPEGQEEMLRLLGINFTAAGEAFVIGEPGKGTRGRDAWSVASAVEVEAEGQEIKVEGETLKGALAIRLWKAHPRISTEANSPARAAIPTLNQMVKLVQVVDAQADSRLTGAGILFIPSEIELPAIPVETQPGDDDENQAAMTPTDAASGVTARLIRAAKIAIDDRSSAAAQIPQVIAAEGEHLEKVQHISFWSGFDEHAKDLRQECVGRLAIGMDMPPEVLTGTAEVNHWGAWQIEEAAIKAHTEPLLGVITASLTTGYLHPYLEAMGVENFEDYTIEADTADLRLRPNRSKEALELWDRGALTTRTLLLENGFDPDADLPDDRERQQWFLAKIASGSTTPDQVAASLAQLGVPGIPGTVEDAQEPTEARPTRSLEEHPNRSAPEIEDSESKAIQASAAFVVDGLVLASEQMVFRALERAGNKLKSKIGRSVGGSAMDLYLSVPTISFQEAEQLLEDGWSTVERTPLGVNSAHLRDTLNDFALMLLRTQKPYTREALSRHLMLELADGS